MADNEEASSGPPAPFTLEPSAFTIILRKNQEQVLALKLTNVSNSYVAFKVKTTSPDRYLVRPAQDVVKPGEFKICKIVLTRISELPDPSNAKAFRDKFLVQSMRLDDGIPATPEELAKLWKEKEKSHNPRKGKYAYSEQKIRCKLVLPDEEQTAVGVAQEAAATQQALVGADSGEEREPRGSEAVESTQVAASTPAAAQQPSEPVSSGAPAEAHSAKAVEAAHEEPAPQLLPEESGNKSAAQQQEYEEIMAYLVKLTAENTRLKQELQTLSQRHNQLASSLESFQKRNAELQERLAAQIGGEREAAQRKQAAVSEATAPSSAVAAIHWWQVLALALLAFLIGKLL